MHSVCIRLVGKAHDFRTFCLWVSAEIAYEISALVQARPPPVPGNIMGLERAERPTKSALLFGRTSERVQERAITDTIYFTPQLPSGPKRTMTIGIFPREKNELYETPAQLTLGLPEATWFESRCQFVLVGHGVEAYLGLRRRDVSDRLQQPAIVEPVDPGQRRKLDGLEASPGTVPMNDLSLVKPMIVSPSALS